MSKSFPSFEAFASFMQTRIVAAAKAQRVGSDAAGNMLCRAAHDMIGQEQEDWPALKPETVSRKQAAGQTGRVSPTDPLYAKGPLRDSFQYGVGNAGLVWGSTDPVMAYHEHGTIHLPPRPVVGPVMHRHGEEAVGIIADHVMGAVAGKPEGVPLERSPADEAKE